MTTIFKLDIETPLHSLPYLTLNLNKSILPVNMSKIASFVVNRVTTDRSLASDLILQFALACLSAYLGFAGKRFTWNAKS